MERNRVKKHIAQIFSAKRRGLRKKLGVFAALVILCGVLSGSVLMTDSKKAEAICSPCVLCLPIDAPITVLILNLLEDAFWQPLIEENIEDHIYSELNWIVDDFFEDFWLKGLAELTEYLTVFGMYQMEMVGTFFDAKNQIETSRLYFKLQAEAHKDYHPSDDFCYFGTNIRSLAASDARARLNLHTLSGRALQRQLGYASSVSGETAGKDQNARWRQFVNTYCDPKDNNWYGVGTGLDFACDRDGPGGSVAAGALDRRRVNKDIDYTATIDEPRTLEFDFSDTHTTPDLMPQDEQDVLAMAANLYGHSLPTRLLGYSKLKTSTDAKRLYLELRSIAAKRSVAVHTFNKIVSMKSAGTDGDSTAPNQPQVGRFMGAVIAELMPETFSASAANDLSEEIYNLIGENPSYYAQMEVLTKKLYQNPRFFSNLYDKPANVARKKVAMKAMELMLDRELLESELRQEMLLSVMLSGRLGSNFRTIDRNMVIEK